MMSVERGGQRSAGLGGEGSPPHPPPERALSPQRGGGLLTFVLFGTGDAGQLGVHLVLLRDLQHLRAVLHHPGQQVRPAGNLKDVLNVGQVVCAGDTGTIRAGSRDWSAVGGQSGWV